MEAPHAATQRVFPFSAPPATPSPRAAINATTMHTAGTYFFSRFMIDLRLLWFECHSAVPLPLLRTAVTSTPSPPPSSLRPSSPFIGRSGGVGPGREPWLQPDGTCSCFLYSGFPIWTDSPSVATAPEPPVPPLSSSTLPSVATGLSRTGERAKNVLTRNSCPSW